MAEQAKMERRVMAMELRAEKSDAGEMRVSGYSAKFNRWAEIGWFREMIEPGAFAGSLTEDVRALFNHDPNIVLGRTTNGTLALREDETGLWMECVFPDTTAARDLFSLIQRGDVNQQSFAFEVLSRGDAWTFPDKGPAERVLKKLRLYDVSPVTYPAYEDTSVAARSMEAVKNQIGGKTKQKIDQLSLRERELKLK